jgi:hypothetical protein
MRVRDCKTAQCGWDDEEQADEWEHGERFILVENKIGQLSFGLDWGCSRGDHSLTKLTATTAVERVGGPGWRVSMPSRKSVGRKWG